MLDQTSIIIAFLAGLVSFLSPCILPIAPVLLSHIVTHAGRYPKNRLHERMSCSAFFFIGFVTVLSALSFLLVFIVEFIAYDFEVWLGKLGWVIIIAFGLYLAGVIQIPGWSKKHDIRVADYGSRHLNALMCGGTSAVQWMPCVGVILGSILGLAILIPEASPGILFAYALGFGLPFTFIGVFNHESSLFIKKHSATLKTLNIIFGVLLVLIAILVFIQDFSGVDIFGVINSYV